MTDYDKGEPVQITIKGIVRASSSHSIVVAPDADSTRQHWIAKETPGVNIERLPDLLYVNAPEITKPRTGDVIRDAASEDSKITWVYITWWWMLADPGGYMSHANLPKQRYLLIRDGKVWPS